MRAPTAPVLLFVAANSRTHDPTEVVAAADRLSYFASG